MLAPNIIRNSRWRCDHGYDIDLDDGSTWYRIYNNVLLNGGLKLREGYDRIAYNNVIINNSLHPHIWYPESGDIFKNNIVFTAYKPALMNKAIAIDGKWGKLIDANFFASKISDLEKFKINNTDAHSLVGNPEFVNAKTGDFRVTANSLALKIGFKNFPMDEFGVVSKKLKRISKTPVIPELISNTLASEDKIMEFLGAKVKNVETLDEQSAAGLPTISGVIILSIPKDAALLKYGFKTSDVILKYDGKELHDFNKLMEIIDTNKTKKQVEVEVSRNQGLIKLKL
jgi:hypothetical protein